MLIANRAVTGQHPLSDIVSRLERSGFYGALEIKFEAGRVVLIRQTQNIKLDDYRNNRGDREQHKP
jgi:hypothetical protein